LSVNGAATVSQRLLLWRWRHPTASQSQWRTGQAI